MPVSSKDLKQLMDQLILAEGQPPLLGILDLTTALSQGFVTAWLQGQTNLHPGGPPSSGGSPLFFPHTSKIDSFPSNVMIDVTDTILLTKQVPHPFRWTRIYVEAISVETEEHLLSKAQGSLEDGNAPHAHFWSGLNGLELFEAVKVRMTSFGFSLIEGELVLDGGPLRFQDHPKSAWARVTRGICNAITAHVTTNGTTTIIGTFPHVHLLL